MEKDRAACEGPAAEFLLYLLGRGNASVDIATLNAEIDGLWACAKDKITTWRQVLFVPEVHVTFDPTAFVNLFPQASLADGRHGFPFRAETLIGSVTVGLHQGDWLGSIPADGQPAFVWLFKRDGRFAYRERMWEDGSTGFCRGQVDVNTDLRLALRATHLFVRLAPKMTGLGDQSKIHFRLDLEGVRGRALVDCDDDFENTRHANRWSSDHSNAEASVTLVDVLARPVDVAISLVAELASQISPEFAEPSKLRSLVLGQRKNAALEFVDYKSIK